MASIKDALEESIQDNHSIIKFILFSIPLYYCIHLMVNSEKESASWFVFVAITTGILLLGYMLKCTYNVRTGDICILPSFNIFGVFWAGIKGLVALAPLIIVAQLASHFLSGLLVNLPFDEKLIGFFKWSIYGIFYSFLFTGYLLYSKSFKIADAYNVVLIFQYCIDVLIAILFMLFQLIFVDIIIVAPVTYVIWLFFGIPSPVSIYFWCLVAVLNIAMIGHYLAQIDYEIIEVKEKN